MKAVVLEDIGALKLTEREIPQCNSGEVLVKVAACSICRTDMKCVTLGQKDLVTPRVLGHELAGVIVQVGQGVQNYQVGDKVQIAPGIACGDCVYCKMGSDNMCEEVKIIGFHYDGGFQEYILIPAIGVRNGIMTLLPANLDFKEAAMTEPLACSINMQQQIDIHHTNTLVIFGGGRLGILNLKLAKANGVEKVILVETDARRVAMAKRFNFDYIINTTKVNLNKEIKSITNNKGVDVVVNCCPDWQAMNQGLDILAKRGRFGFFSGLIMNTNTQIDINKVHYKELSLKGAYGCTLNNNQQALEYLGAEKIKVNDLITQVIGLSQIQSGIEMIKDKSQLSIVIEY